jgi:hypothetical protein
VAAIVRFALNAEAIGRAARRCSLRRPTIVAAAEIETRLAAEESKIGDAGLTMLGSNLAAVIAPSARSASIVAAVTAKMCAQSRSTVT